ncbi:hypothetical protein [Picrophilus oshimae]|uniref:Uncharacterized protein n=1 Tax=Picrophilus torridus (strain ATCC 700027 / DSM 9790 / JCM 10055 / NBRC 100828 / KAW 2/3) TaxID=1122961 RepID=A0A8G2FWZ9_PICTO|nr:hypothetical protein [Picrophilus oshimae]SMD31006.1 hypothetical protein SAMN02745355_0924 [Picrophilus oshimae DSM 9789]
MEAWMVSGGVVCNSAFLSGAFMHHHSHQYKNLLRSDGQNESSFLESI